MSITMDSINKAIYSTQVDLVKAVCAELNEDDKAAELIKKLIILPKSSKPKKDPDRVKKPKNAYMFFCADKREEVKDDMLEELKEKSDNEEEPTKVSTTEVSKKLGAMWKELSDKEKAPYMKMHEEDVERYENEK